MGNRERGSGREGREGNVVCAPPIFTDAPHFLIPGVAPEILPNVPIKATSVFYNSTF